LLSIVLIDLVLAGDNAIIIGIAARNAPKDRQRMVILGVPPARSRSGWC
jgi:predicted tellurium resistance membrane protein TerC